MARAGGSGAGPFPGDPMIGLECAVIDRGPAFRAALERALDAVSQRGRLRERIELRLTYLSWPTAWSELVQRVVHRAAPDIMELGSTWVLTFQAMGALRPLSPSEIQTLGGVERFLLPLWRSARGDEGFWGVPWLADLRLIFYRKDALEEARVEEPAFRFPKDPATLERMLRILAHRQSLIPWVVPTRPERNTLHHIASWIWGEGGDFVKPDGTPAFTEEPAQRGIIAYFRLGTLMGCPIPSYHAEEADQVFWQGHAAATIGGWWIWQFTPPALRPRLGLAMPPGPPFLGGSLLGIWQESRVPDSALMAALTQLIHPETLRSICQIPGTLLPAQPDLWSEPLLDLPETEWEILRTGVNYANTLPNLSLWGVIEDRLNDFFGRIWQAIRECPPDMEQRIRDHLREAQVVIQRVLSR